MSLEMNRTRGHTPEERLSPVVFNPAESRTILKKSDCKIAIKEFLRFREKYSQKNCPPELRDYCFFEAVHQAIDRGVERIALALSRKGLWHGGGEEEVDPEITEEILHAVDGVHQCLFCPLATKEERVWLQDPVYDPTAKKLKYVFERSDLEHFFNLQKNGYKNTDIDSISSPPVSLPSHPMAHDLVQLLQKHFPSLHSREESPREFSFTTYRSNLRRNKEENHLQWHEGICQKNLHRELESAQEIARSQREKEEAQCLAGELIRVCQEEMEEEIEGVANCFREQVLLCQTSVERSEEKMEGMQTRLEKQDRTITKLSETCGTYEGQIFGLQRDIAYNQGELAELQRDLKAFEEARIQEKARAKQDLESAHRVNSLLKEELSAVRSEQRSLMNRVSRQEETTRQLEQENRRLGGRSPGIFSDCCAM